MPLVFPSLATSQPRCRVGRARRDAFTPFAACPTRHPATRTGCHALPGSSCFGQRGCAEKYPPKVATAVTEAVARVHDSPVVPDEHGVAFNANRDFVPVEELLAAVDIARKEAIVYAHDVLLRVAHDESVRVRFENGMAGTHPNPALSKTRA